MNPLLLTDFYKVHHHKMYPNGTTMIYSNLTPRKSRIKGIDSVVVFGIQHFIKKFLIESFNKDFFSRDLKDVVEEYKMYIDVDTSHIESLHKLGYLPIEIKCLKEGSICPIKVPILTIKNTLPEFYWLTNYLETLISCETWQTITSATIAYEYKKLLNRYALETTGTNEFVQWQGHDFSMRGMSSSESAILSGMGHLISFTGTDTIPTIYELKKYYNADGLIGASVPATEHSVMCMGTKEDEIGTFKELLDKYTTGILSVVSDTWDLWKVCTEILPALKEKVLSRDGKLVIRPDSGNPVDIICGFSDRYTLEEFNLHYEGKNPRYKGVIELLWDTFGGSINEQGYKVLDSHIGAIYGDSITLEIAEQICEKLKKKGFASTNIVFGIGSFTYQYNTRDSFGFAVKATYGEVNNMGREIYKDPVTDDGTKKSAKGLLKVIKESEINQFTNKITSTKYKLIDQVSKEEEQEGELKTVFKDGKLVKEFSLNQIRETLWKN